MKIFRLFFLFIISLLILVGCSQNTKEVTPSSAESSSKTKVTATSETVPVSSSSAEGSSKTKVSTTNNTVPVSSAESSSKTKVTTTSETVPVSSSSAMASPTLSVKVLDVGQGDSILITTPRKVVLVDAGTINGSKNLVQLLKNIGVNKIDIFIATHPHADHIGGVQNILKNFPVGQVYDSGQKMPSKLYVNMLKNIAEKNIAFSLIKAGDSIELDKDIYLEVLSPILPFFMTEKDDSKYDLNKNSITTRLVYKDFSMLLTADIEKATENRILQNGQTIQSTILKSPHHGSRTSSSENFLRVVNPEAVLISLGANNEYNHPHKEVIRRYQKMNLAIYQTAQHGTITVQTDGKNYQITSEK